VQDCSLARADAPIDVAAFSALADVENDARGSRLQ
jgi:hypothetical protein